MRQVYHHEAEVSCQIVACFSVKLMTFFLETLVKLVEQGAKFQLKQLCHKLHLQSSDVSSTSLYRCRVFGLAGDAISSLFAVPLCSAQWCLQLGVFALLQFFSTTGN